MIHPQNFCNVENIPVLTYFEHVNFDGYEGESANLIINRSTVKPLVRLEYLQSVEATEFSPEKQGNLLTLFSDSRFFITQ